MFKNQRVVETHWNWISQGTMGTLKQMNPQTKIEKKPNKQLCCAKFWKIIVKAGRRKPSRKH